MAKKKAEPEDLETCSNCRFFLLEHPKDDAGYCRRFPPAYVGDQEEGGFTHPVVIPIDWCGEYRRRTN